jgi:GTP pyrophosphokinase
MPMAWPPSCNRIGAAPSMQAAAYLVYAATTCSGPRRWCQGLRPSYAGLVTHTRKLVQIQRAAREAQVEAEQRAEQTERVRKMLLAFSRDLRVVLLRLASRLQTLRWHAAASKAPCPARWRASRSRCSRRWPTGWASGRSSGRWRTWPSASCSPPTTSASPACWTRSAPSARRGIEAARPPGPRWRRRHRAEVQGRPKHLYSIWKKMQGKGCLRPGVRRARPAGDRGRRAGVLCRAGRVHECHRPVPGEFDDYIARPSPTATRACTPWCWPTATAAPVEVQIRTAAMHEHAEHGVAAHWAYKEAGAKGYAGVSAAGEFEEAGGRGAQGGAAPAAGLGARLRRAARPAAARVAGASFDDRIYVFTPQATIIELPAGRHAGRLRLRAAHRPGPPLPRRAGRRVPWCR